MRISCAPILLLATTAFAFGQSPFVGMWQTSTNRGSNKPAITVVVVEIEKRLGGAVVLVNPDASEIKLPILNLKVTDQAMEFDTRGSGPCFWRLTLHRNNNRGVLHGGCPGEMVVDEPVRKRPPCPHNE